MGPGSQRSVEETFSRLFDEYEPALRRLTRGYAARSEDRDDLFQEIAAGLWGAIPGFRGESSERTWIYRIAHNTALTWKGKKTRRGVHEADDELETRADAGPHPEQRVLEAERRGRLASLIRTLPSMDRQLVLLYLEDLSGAEIAEVSGLSETAVATRLSGVRTRLAERIQHGEVAR